MNSKPLSKLLKGQHGIINSVKNSTLSLKLMEMGLVPGADVSVEAVSPFGDPIAIKVSNYRLSLRLADADNILVVSED